MSYIKSSDLEVFPSTKRIGEYARKSRLLTEQSFARLINQLVDCDSFIINYENNYLEFNIHGYYFNVAISNYLSDISGTLYAHIFIDNSTQELVGQDSEEEEFTGLLISTNKEETMSDCSHYYLELGTVDNDILELNTKNKILFDSSRLNLTTIDSGTV